MHTYVYIEYMHAIMLIPHEWSRVLLLCSCGDLDAFVSVSMSRCQYVRTHVCSCRLEAHDVQLLLVVVSNNCAS